MVTSQENSKSRVTISDIAAACNVSPATVSLVLNDKPGVGKQTRQRVLDAAQSMGYIAKTSLQSQAALGNKTIGLIIRTRPGDDLGENSFYTPVLAGIEAVCRHRQMNLLYAAMPVDEAYYPLELPHIVTAGQNDGQLLVGMRLDPTSQAQLNRLNIPTVLVDAYASDETRGQYDAIGSDNVAGGYDATAYLIGLGHTKIALVGSEPNAYPSIVGRRAGYSSAMEAHNLTPIFWDCPLLPEMAAACTPDYLARDLQVSAVIGCNDAVAIAVMQTLAQLGRKTPDDISIIGFDNIPLAQHVVPALTTMRIDKQGMGRLAAQILVNRLEYPSSGRVWATTRPQLIERASARPL